MNNTSATWWPSSTHGPKRPIDFKFQIPNSLPMRARPSPLFLIFMLLGIVFGVILFFIESPVDPWVLENVRQGWKRAAHNIGKYGDWPQLMGLALLLWLGFRWKGRRDWQRLIVLMACCSTLTGMVVNLSRLTSGRARPSAKVEQGWYGLKKDGEWIVGTHQLNSFPSGHTATAFGFFAPLIFARPRIGIPALLIPIAIGLARIGSRSHHPTDVWWAILIAFAIGWWMINRWWPPPEKKG